MVKTIQVPIHKKLPSNRIKKKNSVKRKYALIRLILIAAFVFFIVKPFFHAPSESIKSFGHQVYRFSSLCQEDNNKVLKTVLQLTPKTDTKTLEKQIDLIIKECKLSKKEISNIKIPSNLNEQDVKSLNEFKEQHIKICETVEKTLTMQKNYIENNDKKIFKQINRYLFLIADYELASAKIYADVYKNNK